MMPAANAVPEPAPPPPGPDDAEIHVGHPGAGLVGFVETVTGYRETRRRHFRMRQTAQLLVPLIVSFDEPFRIGLGRPPTKADSQTSFTAGLFAGPVVIDSFGACACLQIDFTPLGARRFFGVPMYELSNRMVANDALFGHEAETLRERLGNLPDWPARFRLALDFVEARVRRSVPAPPPLVAAYRTIQASGGRVSVSRLAAASGWSRKHLAAMFRDEIGLGAKALARIVRFNRATALARQPEAEWADVAADCGYADQPHLVREFAALGGMTPGEWRVTAT